MAILFGMALATSGVSAQGYTLTGQVKGLGGGSVKLLRYNEDDRTSAPVDSAVLENGSFRMTGRLDYPETLSIVIQPGNWSFGVFGYCVPIFQMRNGDGICVVLVETPVTTTSLRPFAIAFLLR